MEGKIEKIRQYFENSQRNDLEISKHQILEKIKSFEKSVPSFKGIMSQASMSLAYKHMCVCICLANE